MNQKDAILTAAGSIIVALVGWLSTTVISLGNDNVRLESEVIQLREELDEVHTHLDNFESDLIDELLESNTIDDLIDSAHYHTGKGIKIKTYKKQIDR